MANNKLFGTDGVRGAAGKPPLDPPTVHAAASRDVGVTRVAPESVQVRITSGKQ